MRLCLDICVSSLLLAVGSIRSCNFKLVRRLSEASGVINTKPRNCDPCHKIRKAPECKQFPIQAFSPSQLSVHRRIRTIDMLGFALYWYTVAPDNSLQSTRYNFDVVLQRILCRISL